MTLIIQGPLQPYAYLPQGKNTERSSKPFEPMRLQAPQPLSSRAQTQSGFSVLRAARETVKGVFRPITTLIKHPVKTAFTLGATVAVAAAAPVTIPIMVMAGLGFGAVQTARGIKTALQEALKGNYRASEKAFGDIGEGLFSTASSLLGVRQAGAIAAEAKASRLALNTSATAQQKLTAIDNGLKAALTVKRGSYQNALGEAASVFYPEGLKTAGAQLNPVRLAALATGKLQATVRLFTESPVVNLEEAARKAQQFLKIKDKDMPLLSTRLGKHGAIAHGVYIPKTHTLHVNPNRERALANILEGTFLKKPFNSLPEPLKKAAGNWFKHAVSTQEIVTHELTHARQFSEIAKLSPTQARKLLQQSFPNIEPFQLETVLNTLRLKGTGTTQKLAAAHRYLRQYAEYSINDHAAKTMLSKTLEHRNYMNIGFEVEARQKAAEMGIAEVVSNIRKPQSLTQESQLLQKYRSQKLEAKLNQVLAKLNRLKGSGKVNAIKPHEQQLAQINSVHNFNTITKQYIQAERIYTQKAQNEHRLSQTVEKIRQAPQGFAHRFIALGKSVKGWLGKLATGFKSLFTNQGLQRYEQRKNSLRPTYIALNQRIQGQQSSAQ